MKLHDVVKLEKKPRWTKKLLEDETVAHGLVLKEDYDGLNSYSEYAKTREEREAFSSIKQRIQAEFEDVRRTVLLEKHSLPPELKRDDKPDLLSQAAEAHRVNLKEVRAIVDKLGFVVIPFGYLDPRSYAEESFEMKSAIETFNRRLKDIYDIYVVAPVHHYSIDKHVRAEADLPLYAGEPCQQAFMAINMAVPMFRSLMMSVDQLREHSTQVAKQVNANTSLLDKHSQELKNLNRRVSELREQVERQRAEALIAKAEQKRLQEELRTLRSESRFWAYEPMMLAIPKGVSISEDVPAIVGPCWGPDFEDIVMAALELKGIEGQGEMLDKQAMQWIERGASHRRRGNWTPSYITPQVTTPYNRGDDSGYAYAPDPRWG